VTSKRPPSFRARSDTTRIYPVQREGIDIERANFNDNRTNLKAEALQSVNARVAELRKDQTPTYHGAVVVLVNKF
jgi:hypothetical protein